MEWIEGGLKTYEIRQVDDDGDVLASLKVDAESGESAAKQLKEVANGTRDIKICLDGEVMNEMGVDYWMKRVRRR